MLKDLWGDTSDPTKHNPSTFRYLVHGLGPRAKGTEDNHNTDSVISDKNNEFVSFQGDQTVNLYDQPRRVAERVSLSMSLIDQDHSATWKAGGLILEVPKENIIGNGPHDLGSANDSPSLLHSQFKEKSILSPDELLSMTSRLNYNEVIAFANSEGSEVILKGFFVTVNRNRHPVDRIIADQMRKHADAMGLPLVKIEEPCVLPKNTAKDLRAVASSFTSLPSDDYDFRW